MPPKPFKKPELSHKDFKIITKEILFKNYFQVGLYHIKHRLFEGGWSQTISREVFEKPHAAAVLPYDPVAQKVVLNEQFRIGAIEDNRSPWLLEIVAGMMDHDETPEELAIREAKEEAGLEIKKLIPIFDYWLTPGGCNERIKLFCGIVDATHVNGVHGLDEEDEDIKVHVVDVEEAFGLVRDGIINNATAIIALQWLELNRHTINSL